jgi:hypothetical protein
MEHFKDQGGIFVSAGGGMAGRAKMILLIVGVGGAAVAATITFIMLTQVPETRIEEVGGFVPYVPLLTLPGMAMVILVLSKSFKACSRISVNYTTGRVEFPSVTTRGSRKIVVDKEMIRKIVITRKQGYQVGKMTSSMLWLVRILTTEGEHDVFSTPDQAKARGFAGELASLVSKPLVDLTSETG